jgi:hypothetical protein
MRPPHDFLSILDAAAHDMSIGRLADRGSKSSVKMSGTQVRYGSEVLDLDRTREIGVDETGDSVDLPRSERAKRRLPEGAAAKLRRISWVAFRLQESKGSLNTLAGFLLVSGQDRVGETEMANS